MIERDPYLELIINNMWHGEIKTITAKKLYYKQVTNLAKIMAKIMAKILL